MGKTCNAPQITLTQKAHYQHKSQFPYCARRVGRSSLPTSRTGKTIGISTATSRPDFHQGSRLGSPADPTSTREVAETTSGPTLPKRDYNPTGKVDSRLFPTSRTNPSLEIDRPRSFLATRTYVPHG